MEGPKNRRMQMNRTGSLGSQLGLESECYIKFPAWKGAFEVDAAAKIVDKAFAFLEKSKVELISSLTKGEGVIPIVVRMNSPVDQGITKEGVGRQESPLRPAKLIKQEKLKRH